MADIRAKKIPSAEEFAQLAGDWLRRDEGVNSVALGIIESQLSPSPRYQEAHFGVLQRANEIVGTVLMTPPYPLNINGLSTDLLPHFLELAQQFPRPNSVLGPGNFAQIFADRWCQLTGAIIEHRDAQAIHRLEKVNHPGLRGKLRVATEADQKLIERWMHGFCSDCEMEEELPQIADHAKRVIKERSRYLLMVDDRPVSMAGRSRDTANGSTVSYVYTPPELRGKGYASELVAELSQRILDSGKRWVFLYTQLSNPTSNKIYHQVGYRVVSDSWQIRFRYP